MLPERVTGDTPELWVLYRIDRYPVRRQLGLDHDAHPGARAEHVLDVTLETVDGPCRTYTDIDYWLLVIPAGGAVQEAS